VRFSGVKVLPWEPTRLLCALLCSLGPANTGVTLFWSEVMSLINGVTLEATLAIVQAHPQHAPVEAQGASIRNYRQVQGSTLRLWERAVRPGAGDLFSY
jgi:hypothetical protein